MVPEKIPLDAWGVLVGIAELAEDNGRAAVKFQLFRHGERADLSLESVIECRTKGERTVGIESVEPSKKVLCIDGQPLPLNTAIGGQHSVRGVSDGHARRKRSCGECVDAVRVEESNVLGVAVTHV